jgi:hypothetical protein
MRKSFFRYGNSWVNCNDFNFWKKRLNGEINEIFLAKTDEEFKQEISDAINILAMMYEHSLDYEQQQELQNE